MNRLLEKTGLLLLLIVTIAYIGFMVVASIALFPEGIVGLIAIVGGTLIFVQVLKDRLSNAEDDYYAKHVDK